MSRVPSIPDCGISKQFVAKKFPPPPPLVLGNFDFYTHCLQLPLASHVVSHFQISLISLSVLVCPVAKMQKVKISDSARLSGFVQDLG